MMTKKLFFFVALVAFFSSCGKDDSDNNTENLPEGVSSQWKLIAQYNDPGDGSGGFEPVESNKSLVFYDDGTLVCYGSLCSTLTGSDVSNNGVYDASNFIITTEECDQYTVRYAYEDDYLILKYPCDEPCHEKYQATTVINVSN